MDGRFKLSVIFAAMSTGLWHTVYLGLGSNMGNRKQMLDNAIWLADRMLGVVTRFSDVYETAAWGNTDQPAFLNQVVQLETVFPPVLLMQKVLLLEKEMGRLRSEKWGPRNIDVDILFYDREIISNTAVTIPHPQLQLRKFVLVPLNEIAPALVHPQLKKTVRQLLIECEDKLEVKKYI